MTALAQRKTRLTFETDTLVRRRPVVVEPEPLVCVVRLKGTRQRYPISWETIFMHAAEIAARKLREERKLRRQQARRRA